MWRKAAARLGRLRNWTVGTRARAAGALPLGLVVVVAVICIVVAVLSAAQRADEVELAQERKLFANAIADRGRRVMHELENVTASEDVLLHLHYNFDRHWMHRRVGLRLSTFFEHEHVFVIDASDRLIYAMFGTANADPARLDSARGDLARIIDLLRGRKSATTDENLWDPTADAMTGLAHPGRAHRLQTFMRRPAIVAGVAAALPASITAPSGQPPLVLAVKFIDGDLLAEIGQRFDLPGLRKVDETPAADTEHVYVATNGSGETIARFAWTPHRPGGNILGTVLPFIIIAIVGFTLLTGFAFLYIRRTAATIAEGENRLRHLALHDPLSGLPNRTFFGERLAAVIEDVRHNDSVAAVLAIDLDHFKDINDTLGHHVGDGLIRAVAQRLVRVLRDDDLVARLGGDEFAVITTSVPDLDALDRVASRLIEALRAPYAIMGHTLVIGGSIEGVETAEQQLFLRAAGVHLLQGYRFGKPAPAAAITERLEAPPVLARTAAV